MSRNDATIKSTGLSLCTYSRSELLASDILPACPLEIPASDHEGCVCRRYRRNVPVQGTSVLECLYPNDYKGRPIAQPAATREAARRIAHERRQRRQQEQPTAPNHHTNGTRTQAMTEATDQNQKPPPQQPRPAATSAQQPSQQPVPTGRFRPATRQKIKLRMAIDGPSGSGKTVTALRCAQALARQAGGRVAVIDTESGSARKYVGEDFGEGPFQFDVLELTSFASSEYTSAIEEAGRLGYAVIVADSLSHAWEGKDGALETVDKKGKGAGWKDVTPMHRRMVDAILTSPAHVLCTMRSKTEYVYETNEKGKVEPRKVGMAPVQRPGMEYEFDVYGSLDWSHLMTVTKSRCRAVDGLIVAKPGAAFMQPVIDWLERGSPAISAVPAPGVTDDQLAQVAGLLRALGWGVERIKQDLPRKYACTELGQLSRDQADSLVKWLEAQLAAQRKRQQPPAEQPAATPVDPNSPPAGTPVPLANGRPTPPPITPDQVERVRALKQDWEKFRFDRHRADSRPEDMLPTLVHADWRALLAPFGKDSARDLTAGQADEFLAKLADKIEEEKLSSLPF